MSVPGDQERLPEVGLLRDLRTHGIGASGRRPLASLSAWLIACNDAIYTAGKLPLGLVCQGPCGAGCQPDG